MVKIGPAFNGEFNVFVFYVIFYILNAYWTRLSPTSSSLRLAKVILGEAKLSPILFCISAINWMLDEVKCNKCFIADGETRTRNPLGYKPSALAIELNSLKAIAGKELSLSSWCIASLHMYHFSTAVDFSSEKYSGSTGHKNSCYQQRNLQWGCRWWDSNLQPLGYKLSALAIQPLSVLLFQKNRYR